MLYLKSAPIIKRSILIRIQLIIIIDSNNTNLFVKIQQLLKFQIYFMIFQLDMIPNLKIILGILNK